WWGGLSTNPSLGCTIQCELYSTHPLQMSICNGWGERFGASDLARTEAVEAIAFSYEGALEDGWWMTPRGARPRPLLDFMTCASKKAPGDAQDPNDPLWTCDDKAGDVVAPLPVHAENSAEAVSFALADWELLGDEVPPGDVFCRQGDGPIVWLCGAPLRTGGMAVPIPVLAESWQEARGWALQQWGAMQLSVDLEEIDCGPQGEATTGATVSWYCAGEGAGACSLSPVEVLAPADEAEQQVAISAFLTWRGYSIGGVDYSPVWQSVNCSRAGQWVPSNAQIWTCEDATGAAPMAAVPASSESQAVADAQTVWGGAVAVEATVCYQGSAASPCDVGVQSHTKVTWYCNGYSLSGKKLDELEVKDPDGTMEEEDAKAQAIETWRLVGPKPNESTVECEPTEWTDPGNNPDKSCWQCSAASVIPYPRIVTRNDIEVPRIVGNIYQQEAAAQYTAWGKWNAEGVILSTPSWGMVACQEISCLDAP
ncbi:MAG: hypothetical protein ACTHU0_26860, partial [Kofleriaceae bacterium]